MTSIRSPHFRTAALLALGVSTVTLAQENRGPSGFVDSTDGVRLFYQVQGTGPRETVVLHGGPGLSLRYLLPDLQPLVRSRSLIAYDQRGSGRSTIPKEDRHISLDKHVGDLEAIRRHFSVERLTLIGHSWGATVATHYALRHPSRVARLLLIDPMPPRKDPWEQRFAEAVSRGWGHVTQKEIERLDAEILKADDPIPACRRFFQLYAGPYFADRSKAQSSKGDPCADPPEALRAWTRTAQLTLGSLGPDYDWRALLKVLKQPTLIIHGDKDPIPIESAREWSASLPNGRLLVMPNTGHFPFVEQPDVFFAAAERFLSGEWPANAGR
jgi:proline iminopeptidase